MTAQPISIPASSHIAAVAYDAEAQELEVQFVDGSVYIYSDVPEAVATGFSSAISAGKYFHANVRDRYEARQA